MSDAIATPAPRLTPDLLRGSKSIDHAGRSRVTRRDEAAYLLGSHAVDREVQPGLVEQLVQVHIDSPGDRTDLLGESRGKRKIVRHVGTNDLNVNWSGKTKVQNLSDDVGRFEEEGCGGEILWQFFAQFLDIVGGRVMFDLKRDQDLRIEIAYGFAVAVRQIHSAGRQADVVENAT